MEISNNIIIDEYRDILARGHKMLAHAHNGDWDALVALQDEYVCHVAQLADIEKELDLDETTRVLKYELLVEICQAEDSVRGLLHARMREISEIMTQSRSRQRVSQAYEAGMSG
ncbi:flagellar protein FliT [Salinisphaera aquimarina]|uniref:Flagellar protein FliT n=1 Tax=Salinisphaera aquimarina TaxID=2094031 RepID=A0ABV7ES08_9GAMM